MDPARITEQDVEILESALGRVWGLTHLYRKLVLTAQNPRIRNVLSHLAEEKVEQARVLEKGVAMFGGDPGRVRVPREHMEVANRELIPRIFQEEQAMTLWYQEQATAARAEEVKTLCRNLARQESRHQDALKDLYRGLTHC